jgi:hypothetical protein
MRRFVPNRFKPRKPKKTRAEFKAAKEGAARLKREKAEATSRHFKNLRKIRNEQGLNAALTIPITVGKIITSTSRGHPSEEGTRL